jgi:ABC-2 type transport system permease protein
MHLKHILLLLKIKLRILINGFAKGNLKKRLRKLVALIGGGFLFFFLFKWIFDIFTTLSAVTTIGTGLIDNFIIVVFLSFFVFLMISGITVSIHYLFISSDLPLLMVSPLSNNSIFTFKLIEAMFANSTLFFFMGIPIFIAYGIITQAQWYYYPLMVINALLFLAIPISIAFLGALLIVRMIPPQRAREFMAILLGIVSLGIWLVLQIVRASTFDKNSQDFNPHTMTSLQQISQKFLFNLLPSTWAARSLSGFAHSDLRLVLLNFLPLLVFVACIFMICIQLSKNAFRQGFISSEQSVTLKRKKKIQRTGVSDVKGVQSLFSGVPGSIFVRDFKLLFRDTRQLVNILLFAVMMVILPLLQTSEGFGSEFAVYYHYAFIIFFGAIISGQIGSRLIPLEGKSFWITKLVPQSPLSLILGKFMLGFSLSLMLLWTAVIIISIYFHHPLYIILLALITTLCFASAFSSLGLLIGTYFSRFDWDHPKRMLSTTGGLLLSLSAFLIGGLVIVIFVIGYQFQLSLDFLNILVIGVIFLLSLIILLLSNLGAAKKLEKMEWEF